MRLYIRGGNHTKISCHDNWKIEILCLRFFKMLVPTDWNEVMSLFKNLKYVEYVRCLQPKNFPMMDAVEIWRKMSYNSSEKAHWRPCNGSYSKFVCVIQICVLSSFEFLIYKCYQINLCMFVASYQINMDAS